MQYQRHKMDKKHSRHGGIKWVADRVKIIVLIVTVSLLMLSTIFGLESSLSRNSWLVGARTERDTYMQEASDLCPATPCSCIQILSSGEISADCSGRNLSKFPTDLPRNIVALNLSNNALQKLKDEDLKFHQQLQNLDLSSNSIVSLARNFLLTAQNLEILYLNSNYLSRSNDSLPRNVFDNLNSLRELTLHDNPKDKTFNFISGYEYRDDLFMKLKSLQILTIDGIPDANFGVGFSKLLNLKILEVYNHLKYIRNSTFQSFASLPIERLNIKTGSFLQELEPQSFSHFRNLTTLDLGYNRGLDLTKVSAAWYGLQNTAIEELILTRIIPFNMQTTNIEEGFYKYLDMTKIQRIALDRNNIVETYPALSHYFKHVSHLDMSYNRLSNVGSLIADFSRMKNLTFLDTSHQIKRYSGISKRYARKIRPEAISMSASQREFGVLNMNRVLDDDLNACLQRKSAGDALCPQILFNQNGTYPLSEKGPWCFIWPRHLEVFNLSASLNVDLQFMPQIVMLGGHHMKEFIYKGNGISYLTGPLIIGFPNSNILLSVDMSDNGMKCISPDIFKWSIKRGARLGKLTFSNNNLYIQLEQDLTGDVFKWYHYLSELHLDHNGIKSLPAAIFSNLSMLQVLNLSGNSLRSLEFDYSHMNHMQLLDISNNLIASLDDKTLDRIEQHMQASNMSLNVYGNPLQCSCDTLYFLTWMQAKQERLVNFRAYSCMYKGSQHKAFLKLEKTILVELNLLCSTKTALWVSGALLCVTIFAIFLSVVAYRHRWDIRYYLLRLRSGRKQFIEDELRNKQYKYDAFVIYDHRDISWVRHELETVLGQGRKSEVDEVGSLLHGEEGSRDAEQFRFCIHDRDFEAGENINENIISSILGSRKVVLVMSSNLLTSNWCRYELEMAISENVQRGFNTIVPIMLEPLYDISAMSASMQHIVRSLTYIQWPQDELDKSQFWSQLKDSLRQH